MDLNSSTLIRSFETNFILVLVVSKLIIIVDCMGRSHLAIIFALSIKTFCLRHESESSVLRLLWPFTVDLLPDPLQKRSFDIKISADCCSGSDYKLPVYSQTTNQSSVEVFFYFSFIISSSYALTLYFTRDKQIRLRLLY